MSKDSNAIPRTQARVRITDEMRARLVALRREAGVSVHRLLRFAPEPKPPGLESHTVNTWLSGLAKTARADHWQYVFNAWQSLPRRIAVTEAMRAQLIALRTATRIGPYRLLRLGPEPVPLGLKPAVISGCLSGRLMTVRADHWRYIVVTWESLAAAQAGRPAFTGNTDQQRETKVSPAPSPPPMPLERVRVTDDLRRQLCAHRERTGLGPGALLSRLNNRPEGLSVGAVSGWLAGTVTTAPRHHLEYILREWQKATARVRITSRFRNALARERDRTGVSPYALLKSLDDAPRRLRPDMVSAWIAGRTLTAFQHHLDYVLVKWQSLPDGRDSV